MSPIPRQDPGADRDCAHLSARGLDRLRHSLLAWYDEARRDLPWRAAPGEVPDPYRVWISEIMLQQTTVATVSPRFAEFVARWPDAASLAAADLEEVLHAWQGLGYYARARNLHACARALVERHAGRFPEDEAALQALPGVGPYTAGAIAAIAFGRPAAAVDGNVHRVVARLRRVETALPAARAELARLATELTPTERPGDFAQALMDLGATVCRPRRPACTTCPWQGACEAQRAGQAEAYPRRAAKAERPVRHGVVFWAERADGAVLVRRRPPKGLLGGMTEFPSTPWRDVLWGPEEAPPIAPLAADWRPVEGVVHHTFTHFHLELRLLRAVCGERAAPAPDAWWCPRDEFTGLALPTVMKKVASAVLAADDRPGLFSSGDLPNRPGPRHPGPSPRPASPTRRSSRAS